MALTKLVPVRLTVVAQEDIEAIRDGLGALARRDLRIRRLAHEAYAQGGVLSELDLSLVTGYTDGGVSATVIRLRKRGEILPIRGYVADMGSWPTLQAAKHPPEELPLLCAMSPHVVTQYLAILDEDELGRPVYRRRRVRRG